MIEGNYPPPKAVITHHDKVETKGPVAIGKGEAMFGGKGLEGLLVSQLLLDDISIKVQGWEGINKDWRREAHFLGSQRQAWIVRTMGETICMVENTGLVFNHEVILHEVGDGMAGTFAKLVGVAIVMEVGVIRVNGNLVSKKKMPPLLKSAIDSSELFIIDIIMHFSFRECFWVVPNCMGLSLIVLLEEGGASGIVRGVNL
jgi:hypothetical protein